MNTTNPNKLVVGRQFNTENDNLEFYTIYTLVDVTDSGVTDSDLFDTLPYNQNQNLNVLVQIIGLRTQPMIIEVSHLAAQNMSEYKFGNVFKGKNDVWIVKFACEYKNAWSKDDDQVYYLKSDCNDVAFIPKLLDTAKFKINIFNTVDNNKNIYFEKQQPVD